VPAPPAPAVVAEGAVDAEPQFRILLRAGLDLRARRDAQEAPAGASLAEGAEVLRSVHSQAILRLEGRPLTFNEQGFDFSLPV
jgi:hypothetical protein